MKLKTLELSISGLERKKWVAGMKFRSAIDWSYSVVLSSINILLTNCSLAFNVRPPPKMRVDSSASKRSRWATNSSTVTDRAWQIKKVKSKPKMKKRDILLMGRGKSRPVQPTCKRATVDFWVSRRRSHKQCILGRQCFPALARYDLIIHSSFACQTECSFYCKITG